MQAGGLQPQLSMEQAKALMDEVMAQFLLPENKDRLTKAVEDNKDDPQKKLQTVLPMVQEITGGIIEKYGFPRTAVIQAVMAVKTLALQDPDLNEKCNLLQQKLAGNV